MAKKFDIAAHIKDSLGNVNVSDSDTGRQLRYIQLDLIDPDPRNFYSTDGLEALAGNIEMNGLQQPLLVRPAEGGRYIVISGHRRREALRMIRDGGGRAFEEGVPCIVDESKGSEALQELQLIMANLDTRKMTSADQSRQAERIEDLLRQLVDEGYEFPGRLRDWVAELSGMSRTKLARLAAIRNNMVPALYEFYKTEALAESAAYELQKLPAEGQQAIAESMQRSGADGFTITTEAAACCVEYSSRFMTPCKCGDGDECDHHARRFVQVLRSTYHFQRCHGECCLSCSELQTCRFACSKGRAEQKQIKVKADEEKTRQKEKDARAAAKTQKDYRHRRQQEAQRVLPLIEAAGLGDDSTLVGKYYFEKVKVADIRKAAAGDFGDSHFHSGSIMPSDVEALSKWADELGCSIDYLIGREPRPEAAPEKREISIRLLGWLTGTPPDGQRAWAKFIDEDTREFTMLAHYREGSGWHAGDRVNPWSEIDEKCIGWWPLPEDNAPDLPGDLTPKAPEPVSNSDTSPEWSAGSPPTPGLYAVRLKVSETAPGEIHNFARWSGVGWQAVRSGKPITDMIVWRWAPLPDIRKEQMT